VLALFTNLLTAALAIVAFSIYVFLYTPLKTRSTVCTLVGAVSGAIPPMMGWTAAAGHIEPGAWLLFGLLFAWQIPHFLALAWLCREDYERGGFVMLPLVDREGQATCRLVLLYSLAILPIGLAFPLAGLAGWIYTLGSVVLGGGLLALCARLYRFRTAAAARRVFLASVLYLPLLLGLMIADRSSLPVTPLQSSTVELARAESIAPTGPFVHIDSESEWVSRGDF
jgi:protoheme IX farnesyltransferase